MTGSALRLRRRDPDITFEAFNRYEASKGLPADVIRTINATNPDDNAWAKLERRRRRPRVCRGAVDVAAAIGHEINGRDDPRFVAAGGAPPHGGAVAKGVEGFITACLTNNFLSRESGEGRAAAFGEGDPARNAVMAQFHMIESSRIGIRARALGFYEKRSSRLHREMSDAVRSSGRSRHQPCRP
ncbi:MAG: hypothetical protein R2710_05215 [Acidimicrobiales bacterium]